MRVILIDDVSGLGDVGDTVSVKPGYARNFLIPRGKAFEAETSSAKVIKHKMIQVAAKKKKMKTEAESQSSEIRNILLELKLKVGESGNVFGSVSAKDIAAGLQERGFDIERRRVLVEEPIRKLGTHFVDIKLHPEVKAQLKINIVAEAASKEDVAKAVEAVKNSIEDSAAEKAAE